MRGTDTRTTVLDGLVRARELSEVVAGHFWLDLNGVEDLKSHNSSTLPPLRPATKRTHLSVVDANDGANHLGDDDHVT